MSGGVNMYENLIWVKYSNGLYSTYIAEYSDNYKNLLKSEIQEYYLQNNTDKINISNFAHKK